MLQFDARVGDRVRIGATRFTIAGILHKLPGEMAAMSLVAGPRVLIPLAAVEETGLIQPGSLVRYRHVFRLEDRARVTGEAKRLDAALAPLGFEIQTVASRRIATGRALQQFSRYLQLLSLTALLLGGIGVASGIQMHVRRRLSMAAVLRCLGARGADTFAVFGLQVAGLAGASALAGALLGFGIQMTLPWVLGEFLPVTIQPVPVPSALLTAAAAGLVLTLLFALFPRLALRRVSALGALRESLLHETVARLDPVRAAVAAVIGVLFTGFAMLQTDRAWHGLPLETVVASIRKVDWQKMTTNFLVVFPPSVLEEAPQFVAMVSHAATPAASARLQRAVVDRFPHISVIDLSSVLDAVESLLTKVRFIFRFMSLLTILTGAVVLCGSIFTGNSERRRESMLLRTLGASWGQLRRIYLVEYLALGLLAAVLGMGLAYAGAWAVCRFALDVTLAASLPGALLTMLIAIVLTAFLGMALSGGAVHRPPLECLRDEHFA
jgi:predicted lysophospholipase L1 biosynthesis ABC-type transport system permease subunit